MTSGSGSEIKSVLDSVLGRTFRTDEDAPAKVRPVRLHSDNTNASTGSTKSRLEAILGPEFAAPAPAAAAANFQPDLSSPRNSSTANDLLNACGSMCECETCRLLKSTSAPRVPTSGVKLPLSKTSSGGFGTKCQITDCITDDITDDSVPVKELVSSLEDQCKALDLTEPIPVKQGLGGLQKGMRMLSSRLVVSRPVEGLPITTGYQYSAPPSEDWSRILDKLQDLTDPKKVIFREEVEALRNGIMELMEDVKSMENFQKQIHQRIVPRIILCTSTGKRSALKLIHKLTPGLKSVRLHMLCEQEGEEHKVDDAPGCVLHLKEGESWDAIYPFFYHGLRVFQSVTTLAMRATGVGDSPLPSAHIWLKQFDSQIVSLDEDATFHFSKTPQAAAAEAASSPGAEQWLVNHLKGRDMMHDFGLQRMLFEKSNGSQRKGTIVWLCKKHAQKGNDSEFLTNLPTAAN